MHKNRRTRKPLSTLGIVCCCVLLAALFAFGSISALKTLYPLRYEELVEKSSKTNGLEKSFVYAVIKCESGFDPQAISSVGAKGLMQLMPETFDWLCTKTGEAQTEDALFDPQVNIRYGCYLLNLLKTHFSGETDTALAAYHAGIGNVEKWLQNSDYSSDGKTLASIPFASTDAYVQKVNKVQRIYAALYHIK